MTKPLRILLLTANPQGTDRLALDAEHRLLRNRMSDNAERGNCELIVEWATRLRDIKDRLALHKPQVVHFAGHGTTAGICLEDDDGRLSTVSKDQLAELFSSSSAYLQLVMLNACYSAVQSEAIRQSVNYVVGTTAAVADSVALSFAAHFYEALATGKTVREATLKSQIGLDSARRAPFGEYELLIREGTDVNRPLLPPMAPPEIENIDETSFGDAEFEELEMINVSSEGPSESANKRAPLPGHSERNISRKEFKTVKATKASFINNKRSQG